MPPPEAPAAAAAAVKTAAWPASDVSGFDHAGEHDSDGAPDLAFQEVVEPQAGGFEDGRAAQRPLPDRGRRDRAARGHPPRARPRWRELRGGSPRQGARS